MLIRAATILVAAFIFSIYFVKNRLFNVKTYTF